MKWKNDHYLQKNKLFLKKVHFVINLSSSTIV